MKQQAAPLHKRASEMESGQGTSTAYLVTGFMMATLSRPWGGWGNKGRGGTGREQVEACNHRLRDRHVSQVLRGWNERT